MVRRLRLPAPRVLLAVVLLLIFGSVRSVPGFAEEPRLLIFAAASLKEALDAVNDAFRLAKGPESSTSFAASSTLAKHIEAGAPSDVFISADLDWMDYLANKNLIKPQTRTNLLGNHLVLIAPFGSTTEIGIKPDFPLAQALGNGRLAIANPDDVPAGRYGKAALETLGVWSSVSDRLAPAANVRAALTLVARKEAPLGIVYQTDAAASKSVKIVGTFPDDSHPPIIYPMAAVASSTNPAVPDYLAFLKSTAARPIFEKYGFQFLP